MRGLFDLARRRGGMGMVVHFLGIWDHRRLSDLKKRGRVRDGDF